MPHPPFQGHPIGSPFIEMQSVDSTNNYALAQVHAGLAQHGAVFFTHEQWAGKGQRGKTWVAERDSSLIVSAVIDPKPLLITQQFQLSACAATAFCEFFNKYAGNDTCIKWPNDIYWQDRKAGGILIENVIGAGGNWQWAVIGVGININQASFSGELKNPVSLRQITGKSFDTVELAKELCSILDRRFQGLIQEGFAETYQFYNDHLYKKDKTVRFKKGARTFEALVKSVSIEGQLIVQHATEEAFDWGSVEWVK